MATDYGFPEDAKQDKKRTISMRISKDVLMVLYKLCKKNNRTLSNMVETIIRDYIITNFPNEYIE